MQNITKIKLLVIAAPLLLLVVFALRLGSFIEEFGGYKWDLDSINEHFDLPIPADANSIEYDGHRGNLGYLNLSFEAPSESVMNYAAMFCGGKFYQGYDPFNAIDIKEPRENAHLISMREVSYYYTHQTHLIVSLARDAYRMVSSKLRLIKRILKDICLGWSYCITAQNAPLLGINDDHSSTPSRWLYRWCAHACPSRSTWWNWQHLDLRFHS
jgi:hypothetical protein